MEFEIIRVSGYSCPGKSLLMVDGIPVLFANSSARLQRAAAYIQGYDHPSSFTDQKILKLLNKYRKKFKDC